ncbi:MAG: dipeptidase PepV [Cetobacterium sp.]|uniref:dipeptidase PepV n=1 Tax=Cetobacterium sp. TaxID=2071632 RepID=UPI002FCB955F
MNLQEFVLNYREDVIKSIQEAVRIRSVQELGKPGKPFGDGAAEALEYFLELGKSMGFEVENFDNYAGHIDFGNGEEMLGVLGHVDVVPEGDGWTFPPYSATIANGKIYGRGVLDDKGPSIVCLYAMKALKDSGVKLNKKIRMILGANEESGWECMKHYFGKLNMPQPDLAFTPDSGFPVTFAEKGILHLGLEKVYNENLDFSIVGGTALNSVPDSAMAILPLYMRDEIENKIEEFNKDKDYKIKVIERGDKIGLESSGKASHGARPAKGYNSITALFKFLGTLEIENKNLKEIVEFFKEYISMDCEGKLLGVNLEDEPSGKLSLNVGKIDFQNDKFYLGFDIRYPVTFTKEVVIDQILKATEKYGIELRILSAKDPLYVPKDTFLVKTLMNVYQEITGDYKTQPIAIGGGTYARAVKNGVAFGALLNTQEDNMHQRDESLDLDKIDTWLKIYIQAIYDLSK